MGPRVLIVEDEEPLMLLLRYNLEAEGYDVDGVSRGDEAEIRLREQVPDIVLLDWMLPGLSGIELCRRIRARTETERLPVIMLTARGEEGDRIRGLSTGADDYIVKPFSVPELLARVRALLRRAKPTHIATLLRAGDIELDRETHRVRRSGHELHLGPTEFRLLEFLMQSPGRVFSREHLLNAVWGHDVYIDSAPWTCMWAACARRSTCRAGPIPSARCAAPAIPSTRPSPARSRRWRPERGLQANERAAPKDHRRGPRFGKSLI